MKSVSDEDLEFLKALADVNNVIDEDIVIDCGSEEAASKMSLGCYIACDLLEDADALRIMRRRIADLCDDEYDGLIDELDRRIKGLTQ